MSRGELRAVEATLQATRQRLAELEAERARGTVKRDAAVPEETALEQRVAAALQELQTARDALASVEVKLNILEGAANVLDRRTRTGSASH